MGLVVLMVVVYSAGFLSARFLSLGALVTRALQECSKGAARAQQVRVAHPEEDKDLGREKARENTVLTQSGIGKHWWCWQVEF